MNNNISIFLLYESTEIFLCKQEGIRKLWEAEHAEELQPYNWKPVLKWPHAAWQYSFVFCPSRMGAAEGSASKLQPSVILRVFHSQQ